MCYLLQKEIDYLTKKEKELLKQISKSKEKQKIENAKQKSQTTKQYKKHITQITTRSNNKHTRRQAGLCVFCAGASERRR